MPDTEPFDYDDLDYETLVDRFMLVAKLGNDIQFKTNALDILVNSNEDSKNCVALKSLFLKFLDKYEMLVDSNEKYAITYNSEAKDLSANILNFVDQVSKEKSIFSDYSKALDSASNFLDAALSPERPRTQDKSVSRPLYYTKNKNMFFRTPGKEKASVVRSNPNLKNPQ
jgi:hypothetical protein